MVSIARFAWDHSRSHSSGFKDGPDSGPACPAPINGAGAKREELPEDPAGKAPSGNLFTAEQVASLLQQMTGQATTKEQRIIYPLVALGEKFTAWAERRLATRTIEGYREFWSDFSSHCGPETDLEDVTHQSVYEWLDSRTEWGPTRRRNAIIALKRICNWAAKSKLISASPLAGIEMPAPNTRQSWVTEDMHRQLLALTPDQPGRDLLQLAWETGARPQELRIITVEMVEIDRSRIVIPKGLAKGRKRARIIYLSPAAVEIVRGLMRTAADNGPLLRNSRGTPWTAFSISCRFRRLRAQLPAEWKGVCLYSYRHGFAYRNLDQGQDSLTVATLMGHTDTTMLARVYSHLGANERLMRSAVGHS